MKNFVVQSKKQELNENKRKNQIVKSEEKKIISKTNQERGKKYNDHERTAIFVEIKK